MNNFKVKDKIPLYEPDIYLGYKIRSNLNKIQYFMNKKRSIITNERGWLTGKDKYCSKCKYLLAGASWIEGSYEDWKNTIAGNIQLLTNHRVANIGVGNYNLIQIVRRIEKEIKYADPDLVILQYSHGYIDRSIRNIVLGVLSRPTIVPFFEKYILREPKVLSLETSMKYFDYISNSEDKKTIFQFIYLLFYRYFVRFINSNKGKRFFLSLVNKRYKTFYKKGNSNDKSYRNYVLKYCMSILNSTLKKYSIQCLIITDPYIEGKTIQNQVDIDQEHFYRNNYSNIKYVGYGKGSETHKWKKYQDNYYTNTSTKDKILYDKKTKHPNSLGYKLIAEAIVENINFIK